MGASAIVRFGASAIMLGALCASLQAHQDDDNGNDNWNGDRRSTWELNTSLTFHRYFEPFARVVSARACRDRCVHNRRCSGWTYYDANFREAGSLSYKLQRVCVLGAGLRDRQTRNRPGRTSGEVRSTNDNDND
jgi:hypothetical protein